MKQHFVILMLLPLLLTAPVQAEALSKSQLTRSQLLNFISCNLAIGWYCARILMQSQKLPTDQS